MIKFTKKKIVAGALAVTLVTGAGFSLAATDFGAKLQSWYNKQYSSAITDISTSTTNYGYTHAVNAWKQVQNMSNKMKNDIERGKNDAVSTTNGHITDQTDEYINQINSKKEEILNRMETDFDNFRDGFMGMIDEIVSEAKKYSEDHLNEKAAGYSEAALADLEAAINAHADSAIQELQAAIDAAKSEINAKLNTEKATTLAELKAYIDSEKARVLGELQSFANSLVNDIIDTINQKAAELEAEALAALEAMASQFDN